jgi:hypothetical protein
MEVIHAFEERPMDVTQLMTWVDEPETHRKIVGDYAGSYALGVTDNPVAFLLRVEPADVSQFPTKVHLHGLEVPVIVRGNFVPPVPVSRPQRTGVSEEHS